MFLATPLVVAGIMAQRGTELLRPHYGNPSQPRGHGHGARTVLAALDNAERIGESVGCKDAVRD